MINIIIITDVDYTNSSQFFYFLTDFLGLLKKYI